MADEGVETTPDERPENPATACERECVGMLMQANELSRFETAKAHRIWGLVGMKLALAVEQGWVMDTVLAMHTLLQANLLALSSKKTDETLERLHQLYAHAILAASKHVNGQYVLLAKRAYAAVLVDYNLPGDALRLLLDVDSTLRPKKKEEEAQEAADHEAEEGDDQGTSEDEESNEALCVQVTLQLAEARLLLGSPKAALQTMKSISYADSYIHMNHVAAKILHAQLLRAASKDEGRRIRREQRRRARSLERQAARDVHRVVSQCHPSSVRRAQLLRIPLVGPGLYKLACKRMRALRL